jgi:hypothetical protein
MRKIRLVETLPTKKLVTKKKGGRVKMRGDWAPAKVGHRAMRRFLGQTALVVGGTGGALFAAGAVYFRSRNASPIQHTEFPEAAGKTFVVTGGTSGIGVQTRTRATRCGRLCGRRDA